MKLRIRESSNSLHEQDVEIEVKNKDILEVPEDKNVDDLPMSHFEKLVKKHGLSKITKALNNLQVWNKNDDKELSKWAGNMIDKLTKKFGKNESLKEDTIDGVYVDIDSLSRRYRKMMLSGELDDIIALYHEVGGDFDEFAIEATERGFSKIDIFTVGLCVEGIPVKEIEKRLRMLHLMDESISVKKFNEGWYNGNASISFTHNDDLEADLEEFLFDLFSDNPDVFEFDWSGKDTKLYLACNEDDYKYIKWFIEDWKYKHRDEYDESLKEYYDAQDFDRGTEDMFNYGDSDIYDDIPDEPFTEEDEFNYYVDYVYNHTRNPQEAARYLKSEGKSKEYIDQVIAAVDEIYG